GPSRGRMESSWGRNRRGARRGVKQTKPFTTRTHMPGKRQRGARASHSPIVIERGKVRSTNSGDALYICHPEPIMTIMASALIQWVMRTHNGWMSSRLTGAVVIVVSEFASRAIIQPRSDLDISVADRICQ